MTVDDLRALVHGLPPDHPEFPGDALYVAMQAAVAAGDLKLVEWLWPPPAWYGPYSPGQRIAGARYTFTAMALRIIPPPAACSICGRRDGKLHYHAEDYERPLSALHPICAAHHAALHRRFRAPEQWRVVVAQYGDGRRWFENLQS